MPTDPYDPDANPNLWAALVSFWLATPELVAISRAPFADEAPTGVIPPYCVLSETSATLDGRGSKAISYREETLYQFAIYEYDQVRAAGLGRTMIGHLDGIHDRPVRFADGYLKSWFRTSPRMMKVPEVNRAGSRTIWQQAHTYRAVINRLRVPA